MAPVISLTCLGRCRYRGATRRDRCLFGTIAAKRWKLVTGQPEDYFRSAFVAEFEKNSDLEAFGDRTCS